MYSPFQTGPFVGPVLGLRIQQSGFGLAGEASLGFMDSLPLAGTTFEIALAILLDEV
jgi:hypothetical protein